MVHIIDINILSYLNIMYLSKYDDPSMEILYPLKY